MDNCNLSNLSVNITSAFLETTSICNLRCKHCYNDSGNDNRVLSVETIDKFVAGLIPFGTRSVAISGGEPLLHPSFDKILQLMTKYPIDYRIITNGTLINKFLSLLKLYSRRVSLQISIDGLQEAHNALRGIGTFEKIINNVGLLAKSGIVFYFKTTINKLNHRSLEDIIKLAISLGGISISFSFLNPIGRGLINTELHMSDNEIVSSFAFLEVLKEKYTNHISFEIPHLYRNSICPWYAYNEEKELKISPRIDVDGNVFLCNAFMNPKFSIGNINDSNLESIVSSEKTIQLLNFIKLSKNYVTCPTCVLSRVCNRGCPASFIEKIGEYDDNFCTSRRISFVRYLCEKEKIEML